MFQFYPENAKQIEMITAQSMRAGFTGGLVVDFPNSTKAKKYFLVLMTGGGNQARHDTNHKDSCLMKLVTFLEASHYANFAS